MNNNQLKYQFSQQSCVQTIAQISNIILHGTNEFMEAHYFQLFQIITLINQYQNLNCSCVRDLLVIENHQHIVGDLSAIRSFNKDVYTTYQKISVLILGENIFSKASNGIFCTVEQSNYMYDVIVYLQAQFAVEQSLNHNLFPVILDQIEQLVKQKLFMKDNVDLVQKMNKLYDIYPEAHFCGLHRYLDKLSENLQSSLVKVHDNGIKIYESIRPQFQHFFSHQGSILQFLMEFARVHLQSMNFQQFLFKVAEINVIDVIFNMSFDQIMDFYFKDSNEEQIKALAIAVKRWRGLPKNQEFDDNIHMIYETRYCCYKHILTNVLQRNEDQRFARFELFCKLVGQHPKFSFTRLVNFRRSLWMELDFFPGKNLSTLDLYNWVQMLQMSL